MERWTVPPLTTTKEIFCFSGRGEVYSFTVVTRNAAPAEFEQYAPYVVAIVRLEEGPLVTAMLTDVEKGEVHIGMKVERVTRVLCENGDHGLIHYGYKFRPVMGSDPLEEGSS